MLFNLDGYVSENRCWKGIGNGVWRRTGEGKEYFSEATKAETFAGGANGAVK